MISSRTVLFGALLAYGYFTLMSFAQSNQQPIGAYRVYPKTTFQCVGRPSGYYADVETGCQVYHMCDGLGRQFSYSCPNTTLFQQRMLVCDHWYMVNCSRAESNYDANLLIGQKDKPFVTDRENELRTPRPDLLDRPYAPDYAGESFRNHYKTSPNALDDVDDKKHLNRKSSDDSPVRPNQPYTFSTHWSTQHPSKLQTTPQPSTQNVLQPSQHLPLPTNAALHRRSESNSVQQESAFHFNNQPHSDLGVSSSQDSRRTEDESIFENTIQSVSVPTPSVQYTPPHHNPKYNEHFNFALSAQQLPSTVSATTFHQPSSTTKLFQTTTVRPTTTVRSVDKPTPSKRPTNKGFEGKEQSTRGSTKYTSNSNKYKQSLNEARILTRPESINEELSTPSYKTRVAAPTNDLLPPYEKLLIYDDSTTQGPLIYSEWKIPSSGLLPPHPEKARSHNSIKPASHPSASISIKPVKRPAIGLEPPRYDAPSTESPLNAKLFHNPFHKSLFVQTTPVFPTNPTTTEPTVVRKSPTPRSISSSDTTSHHDLDAELASNRLLTRDNHYLELKKLLHIPDYTFPLESDNAVRSHYGRNDSVNSFLVRIPIEQKNPSEGSPNKAKPWYGENAKCPECHPSFAKPGTCEPCIKIRR